MELTQIDPSDGYAVLAEGVAAPPPIVRAEKAEPLRDEILELHASCKGNLVRVHEELTARGHTALSYQALTAFRLPTRASGRNQRRHTEHGRFLRTTRRPSLVAVPQRSR
jgi:hypothetical protein